MESNLTHINNKQEGSFIYFYYRFLRNNYRKNTNSR